MVKITWAAYWSKGLYMESIFPKFQKSLKSESTYIYSSYFKYSINFKK
jgi:hypothetical protein